MPLILPYFLLALPAIEIAGFVVIGDRLGVSGTLLATFATAALGLFTLRFQVASLPARARAAFARDEPPMAEAMVELLRALGGVLLLIPGFFTDFVGLLLLIPVIRLGVIYLILARITKQDTARDGSIIDASYADVTPAPTDHQVEENDRDGDDPADDGRAR
jgi:UPF0716 protein FxsA